MAIRRNARLRREYLYRKSLEGKAAEDYERKARLRAALQSGKAIPTELRKEAEELKKEIDLEDDRTGAAPRVSARARACAGRQRGRRGCPPAWAPSRLMRPPPLAVERPARAEQPPSITGLRRASLLAETPAGPPLAASRLRPLRTFDDAL
jgi:hypothetical protein